MLQALGRLDEARDQYEQALTMSLAALGPDHRQTQEVRNSLARLLARAAGPDTETGAAPPLQDPDQ